MKEQKVIDSDGHVTEFSFTRDDRGQFVEGKEIWSEYLEKKYLQRAPKVVVNEWGHHAWLFEGIGIPAQGQDFGKYCDVFGGFFDRAGGFEPKARLKDMDQEGIDQAVLYPTLFLGLELLTKDVQFSTALARAYNNWLADYCSADRRRLKGAAVVPLISIEESCKELRRAVKDLGFVAIKMPPLVFRKMLDHPDFYPLYAELQELDVPLGIHHHVMALDDTGVAKYDERMPLQQAACFPHDTMLAMGGLIYGGVLDRFPKLRVAFLECGCSWIPYWMRRLEQHTEFAKIGYPFPGMKKSVIEHMKSEQCYYHAESEEIVLPLVFKEMGEQHFMYASDYPHYGDAITPFGAVAEWKRLTSIPESARRKVLGENAARLYRLDD